ncbi:hypothetical protein [Halorussus pelagicus]|uniref:hypothetical protein n=1 Tax=Halorussus pelagicus TaxID=2505977 RepID=UPI000FFC1D2D|nr:hypothetical protein [Halorussus pelagicus]
MNIDELRTVQSKERSKDSLQHLRESFYADVADYIADLKDRRDRAAQQTDSPFDDPEVNRLTDEIKTAEDVVEAVYERRVGKIVKRASLAAAGMPADEEGLTSEEQDLFDGLVERIESNKEDVLDVLAGEKESPAGASPTPTPAEGAAGETGADPTQPTGASARDEPTAHDPNAAPDPGDPPAAATSDSGEDVSAADVMGGGDDSTSGTDDASDTQRPAAAEAAAIADASGEGPAGAAGGQSPGGESPVESADAPAEQPASGGDADDDPLAGLDERVTVRVTDDVGEIFGVDERTYDLASEDVVTLPEANAAPLVERGAAEELE